MTKTNNSANIIQGDSTKSLTISGYCIPISKYSVGMLSNSSQNLSTISRELSGMSVTLPDQGIYEIKANISENISSITVNASANYSIYQLYDGSLVSNSERLGFGISTLSSSISGRNLKINSFSWLYNNSSANKTISLYGRYNTAITGSWKIDSDSNGRSVIFARLLV